MKLYICADADQFFILFYFVWVLVRSFTDCSYAHVVGFIHLDSLNVGLTLYKFRCA